MALICVAGMNHSPPAATIRSPAMMPPLYPSRVASHPAGSDIRKLAEIVRELHPGGLGLAQAQLLLEVLVHHVDHPVAETPIRSPAMMPPLYPSRVASHPAGSDI